MIKSLYEYTGRLEANYKTLKKDINQRLNIIQKTEVELSNRLELIKLDIKEKIKKDAENFTSTIKKNLLPRR
ncbi:MAG: hypothetical protein E3K32_05655 [wastewater metagenome]|nr:hypothetical protein [Candidatus Loosdrechtia aerotolerans]